MHRMSVEKCSGSFPALMASLRTCTASKPLRSHRKESVMASKAMQPAPQASAGSAYESLCSTSGAR